MTYVKFSVGLRGSQMCYPDLLTIIESRESSTYFYTIVLRNDYVSSLYGHNHHTDRISFLGIPVRKNKSKYSSYS